MKFLLGLLGSTALVAGGTIPTMLTMNTLTSAQIENGHLIKRISIRDQAEATASSSINTNGKNQAESPYSIVWEAEELGISLEDWFSINWEKSTILVDAHYSFKDGDDFGDEEEGNMFINPTRIDMAHFEKKATQYLDQKNGENNKTIGHYTELALDINFDGVTLRARTSTNVEKADSGDTQVASTTMVIRTVIFNLYFNK